ncbi:MAG: hypothetical protein HQK52_07055 [Oligoflexia bacterium]|nr:hypothetical protein [Oligoflexia bacterium]
MKKNINSLFVSGILGLILAVNPLNSTYATITTDEQCTPTSSLSTSVANGVTAAKEWIFQHDKECKCALICSTALLGAYLWYESPASPSEKALALLSTVAKLSVPTIQFLPELRQDKTAMTITMLLNVANALGNHDPSSLSTAIDLAIKMIDNKDIQDKAFFLKTAMEIATTASLFKEFQTPTFIFDSSLALLSMAPEIRDDAKTLLGLQLARAANKGSIDFALLGGVLTALGHDKIYGYDVAAGMNVLKQVLEAASSYYSQFPSKKLDLEAFKDSVFEESRIYFRKGCGEATTLQCYYDPAVPREHVTQIIDHMAKMCASYEDKQGFSIPKEIILLIPKKTNVIAVYSENDHFILYPDIFDPDLAINHDRKLAKKLDEEHFGQAIDLKKFFSSLIQLSKENDEGGGSYHPSEEANSSLKLLPILTHEFGHAIMSHMSQVDSDSTLRDLLQTVATLRNEESKKGKEYLKHFFKDNKDPAVEVYHSIYRPLGEFFADLISVVYHRDKSVIASNLDLLTGVDDSGKFRDFNANKTTNLEKLGKDAIHSGDLEHNSLALLRVYVGEHLDEFQKNQSNEKILSDFYNIIREMVQAGLNSPQLRKRIKNNPGQLNEEIISRLQAKQEGR